MIYIFTHADVSFIVVEDQEQVDKILEMWPELQNVRKVVYYDPKGLRNYTEDFLIYFSDVQDIGRQYEKDHPGWWEKQVADGSANDIAILSTTSGTASAEPDSV